MSASPTQVKPMRQLDWLDNVENIRPVRGGHSAAAVMGAVNAPIVTVSQARERFTKAMKEAEKAEDPLPVMIKYVKWFDDHFLSGKVSVLQPMIYQILTKYGTDPRYRNDERIMKLWLKLADNFPERGFAVMQLACSRGSCKELAKFYIFWSKMYEYAEQMERAREIIARGIYNRAIPINELHEASDQLEVRICLWTMEKQKRQEELDLDDDDIIQMADTRPVFRRIEVEETDRGYRVPSVRDDTSTPKRLKINPKIKPDFEIYCDSDDEAFVPAPLQSNLCIPLIEDELKSDPDWQSIFGYVDQPHLHIDITENTVPSEKMGARGVPGIKPVTDHPLAAFSIYCENQKVSKLKFAVRRELVFDLSIEEAFAQKFLEPDNESPGMTKPMAKLGQS